MGTQDDHAAYDSARRSISAGLAGPDGLDYEKCDRLAEVALLSFPIARWERAISAAGIPVRRPTLAGEWETDPSRLDPT